MRNRWCRLAVVLVLAAAPGCFVNEIDKSMAAYENNGGKGAKPAAPPGAATAPADAGKPGAAATAGAPAVPSGPSWWQTARTLGSEPMDDTIAACALDGRVEYQRRDDCLARGGSPQ